MLIDLHGSIYINEMIALCY